MELERVLPDLDWQSIPAELRDSARAAWESLDDPVAPDLVRQRPRVADTLPKVWACSEFVARTCCARPTILRDLLESGDLERRYDDRELHRRLAGFAGEEESELMQYLRWVRTREALRIAWRDLAGWADLEEVVTTLSQLADACIGCALDHAFRWNCASHGTPIGATSGQAVSMSVLGLGKLGGRELNFSSDVDLIFVYSEEGETQGQRAMSNHEFFVKLGHRLIRLLDQATADGFVFRVDMRLRPNGNSGPLALSFDAIEHYYQTHGRDWERYALIKARVVAGDLEAGARLLARLRPFVYRRYLDYGAFEAIRSMKDMISRELQRRRRQEHVKLGRGGIREIEFIVQSFQLIRGGRDRSLQTNRLFAALAALGEIGALSGKTVNQLRECYVFLRSVEHRLQMIADQQTHLLPTDPADQLRVAAAMDQSGWESLLERLEEVMRLVHGEFQGVFAARTADQDQGPTLTALRDVWLHTDDQARAEQALAGAGYTDPGEVWRRLHALRRGKLYQAHSKYGRERLDRLMPALIEAAAGSDEPEATLSRLIHFVEAVGRRSAYLVLLIENPLALDQLVKLCAASEWIGNWISRHPLLLDELLDPISIQHTMTDTEVIRELDYRLAQIETDDLEAHMEALREVRHANVLGVAAADVSGLIEWTEVGKRLCDIAIILLHTVAELARGALEPRFGVPSGDPQQPPAFGIVAYGKLGGGELGYNSDLDLVFLHAWADPQKQTSGGARSIANEQYFGRLVQRIVHMITTRTPAGVLYDIDMRLRPSGRAGPLVTSIEAFQTYQEQNAWTWEHQALVRARMISGPEALRGRFEDARTQIITQQRDAEPLRRDIAAMRAKMVGANDQSSDTEFDIKQGRGGIIDIEFIVQYYVLLKAHEVPDLAKPRGIIDLIGSLEETGCIDGDVAAQLSGAYNGLMEVDHRLKLADKPPLIDRQALAEERRFVIARWAELFDDACRD